MGAQNIRLLLVEDNPKDARLVCDLLHEDPGTSIHQVDRLAAATEHLAGHEIDIVLLNLGLADSQGLDTLRSVTMAAPRVPVVVFTGRNDDVMGRVAVREGAQDYLPKGSMIDGALMRTIHHAIERGENRAKLSNLSQIQRATRNVSRLILRQRDPQRLIEQTCELLVEARGYRGAWIALTDENGSCWAVGSAGSDDASGPFAQAIKLGALPSCCMIADAANEGRTFSRTVTCGDCLLAKTVCRDMSAVTLIRHDEKRYGFLGIAMPKGFEFDAELPVEVAGELGFALHDIELHDQSISSKEAFRESEKQLKVAETALQRSEATFRAVFQSITDGIVLTDARTKRFVLANRAICEMLGYNEAEMLQLTVADIYSEAALPTIELDIGRVLAGEKSRPEILAVRRKDGSVFRAEVSSAHATDLGRDILVGCFRDVTERTSLQASLAQADRLASVGMLAAGVAHEINNPLSYVLSNLQTLADDLPRLSSAVRRHHNRLSAHDNLDSANEPDEDRDVFAPAFLDDVNDRARDALTGIYRIKEIARGLGTFSRVEQTDVAPVNIEDAIECAINMAYNEIKYRARLIKDFQRVPPALASDGKLAQVFLNLMINAAHAVGEGNVEGNQIRVRTWADEFHVFAEVSDTGKGIPVDCQGRIFEPFFTTKGVGVGSGLGLSICKNIVTGFGGKISFTSQIGKGTQFVVELPITPADWEAHPQTLPPAPNAPDFMPRGRILVVDDEPAICAAVRRLLKSRHDVVTAASAEACKVILERDQAFDLLFFDIMMPGTSGMELHQWLENINPALADQVVFVSGGAFTPNAAKYLQEAGNLQVEKPFDATSLKKLVGELVLAAKAKRRQ